MEKRVILVVYDDIRLTRMFVMTKEQAEQVKNELEKIKENYFNDEATKGSFLELVENYLNRLECEEVDYEEHLLY